MSVCFDIVASVAVESWRVQQRNIGHLDALGDLRITASMFDRGLMLVTPCQANPLMLLVGCVEGSKLQPSVWRDRAAQVRMLLEGAMRQGTSTF
jgi:hypothetical protein